MSRKSNSKKSEPKKVKEKKTLGIFKPVKSVISGDFLDKGLVERNLPFLLFVTSLMLVYIGYQYYTDNQVRERAKVEKQSAELYSKLQSVKEQFNEHSLQSKVAKGTMEIGMYESVDPPKVIEVNPNELSE